MDEIARFRSRTPQSEAMYRRGLRTMPLGVESNFRFYDPYPLYIDRASGTRVWDVDDNEYIDYGLCFGALMVGHAHPVVVEAVARQAARGSMFGMPNALMFDLAEELCRRFTLDKLRFTNSGTESTMHALRVARGATGRDRILKFEGAYHGVHDAMLIGVKPPAGTSGDAGAPLSVPASQGIPASLLETTVVATFNDLESVRAAFKRCTGEIAGIILEPVMMNIGMCLPEPGFLEGLREICDREGALLIFDEVKTGSKLAAGGAREHFGVKPDLVTMAKSFGAGCSIGAFGGRADVMAVIDRQEVFHAGTYNANPLVVAGAIAGLRGVLKPEIFARVGALNDRLLAAYRRIIADTGLVAYVAGIGANGCIYFGIREPVRNYRDFLRVDKDQYWQYFFGMVNRGVIPCAAHHDEQWTISAVHTDQDIDTHIATFAEVAKDMSAKTVVSGQ